jgi:hypothetical protein
MKTLKGAVLWKIDPKVEGETPPLRALHDLVLELRFSTAENPAKQYLPPPKRNQTIICA